MELSVIVPCLNEVNNLRALAARIECLFARAPLSDLGAELILVDDGSRDGTWALIESLRARHAFIRGVRHLQNRGIAESWRSGARAARGRLVAVLDADLQYAPEDLARLYEVLKRSGADVVQGARVRAARDSRFWISRGLNLILNALFRMTLGDNQSGFLLLGRDAFEALLDHRGRYHHWQNLAMVAAHAHGYRIAEIPTVFGERRAGRSAFGDLPLRAIALVLADVGRALFEYRAGRAPRAAKELRCP